MTSGRPLSALQRIPNLLTSLRLVLALCFLAAEAFEQQLAAQITGLVIFFLASLTDIFDGWMARRYGAVTQFGLLMDPIADKILVASALIVFVHSPFIRMPAWPVALIIGREFAMTGLRLLASAEGVTLGADWGGKFKTIMQMVGLHYFLIVDILQNPRVQAYLPHLSEYRDPLRLSVLILMYFVTAITVYTGIDYLIRNYRYLVSGSQQS